MRAGNLNRQIEILTLSDSTPNKYNETPSEWEVLETVWAEKKDVRGKEFVAAGAEAALHETVFKIRYSNTITAADRVKYDGVVFEIISPPVELGNREATELYCKRTMNE